MTLRPSGFPAKIFASASSRLGLARAWSHGRYRSPQRRRQEARRRLNERSRALASRILNALGASINGRNIVLAYPELRSANNYAAVIMIVNGTVNERLESDGGTRGEIPLERLEEVLEQIDQIGDGVQAQIQERLSRR